MKVLILIILSSFSFLSFSGETEGHKLVTGLNQYGCSLSLESRVFENDTLPSEYKTTVGFNYYFFKKRPSIENIDLDFYGKEQDELLHIVQVLPSFNSDEHKIVVESLRVLLGQEVLYFDKAHKFDPSFPRFSLSIDQVKKVYSQLIANKKLEFVYTYSNKSELRHLPIRKDIDVYSKMFETCTKNAK